jgi:cellulose synthase/poly-beta-1,6-N-acetylglucosamine synthase-like glycosyltransferase
MGAPAISVVVVSDFAGGEVGAWRDLAACLAALARQELPAGRFEVLYVESEALAERIPAEVVAAFPGLRLVLAPAGGSYALKNAGVEAADGELVAVLDADCMPESGWLAALSAALERHPEASAVSGRTFYPGDGFLVRTLALLDRAYVDPGRAGPTRFVSNNNSAFRREAFLRHPLPIDAGPFANRLQTEAMLRDGARFFFEPAARVVHDFEGWAMARDIRRQIGWGTVATRLRDRRLPWAGLTRLGLAGLPLIVAGKTLDGLGDCLRCAHAYGVRGYELPAALALAVWLHLLEAPGMALAFRGLAVSETAYR